MIMTIQDFLQVWEDNLVMIIMTLYILCLGITNFVKENACIFRHTAKSE